MTESEALNMIQAKLICMELYDLSCIEKGCDKKCENCEYNYAQGNNGEQKGSLKVAIQALEKQTPKIPTYEGDGYDPEGNIIFDEWLCPSCGTRYEVDYDEHDFCPNCGQKIDWGEEE